MKKKATGHSQQSIGRILKGEGNPRLSTVLDIIDAIGVDLQDLPKYIEIIPKLKKK